MHAPECAFVLSHTCDLRLLFTKHISYTINIYYWIRAMDKGEVQVEIEIL